MANLDSSELLEFLNNEGLDNEEEAGKIIMSARAHWFDEPDETAVENDETVD